MNERQQIQQGTGQGEGQRSGRWSGWSGVVQAKPVDLGPRELNNGVGFRQVVQAVQAYSHISHTRAYALARARGNVYPVTNYYQKCLDHPDQNPGAQQWRGFPWSRVFDLPRTNPGPPGPDPGPGQQTAPQRHSATHACFWVLPSQKPRAGTQIPIFGRELMKKLGGKMEKCTKPRTVTKPGESGNVEQSLSAAILNRFSSAVLDEQTCRQILIEVLHAGGADCPHCGLAVESDAQLRAWAEGGRLQCRQCHRWLTYTSCTILAGSALNERQVVLLAVLAHLDIPNSLTAVLVGCSPDTIRRWRARL